MEYVAIIAAIFGLAVLYRVIVKPAPRADEQLDMPAEWRPLLKSNVAYYNTLDSEAQMRFENLIMHFLAQVDITGVGTQVTDLDRILVASGAVIPIFGLDDTWLYPGLHEVLLYPRQFDEKFAFSEGDKDDDRNILGMVGHGQMSSVMILSQPSLRRGFANARDRRNVAVHEFAHLIDKADGTIDGIPDILFEHRFTAPWLQRIRTEVAKISAGDSDINPYGASRREEFFPVVAEYFFENPKLMRRKHPELYAMLQKAFRQSLADKVMRRVKRASAGRNAPCPCGSGRKYKHCCLKNS